MCTERVRDHPRTLVYEINESMLEKLGQAIKQAPRYESSDQALVLAIKIFDCRRRCKYGAYSGDYPLSMLL